MIIRRIGRSHRYQTLLRSKNPTESPSAIPHLIPSCRSSISFRPFSLWAQFEPQEDATPITSQNVVKEREQKEKPLSIYFKEAVGILEKSPEENETEFEGKHENAELKEKLKKLEEELRFSEENLKNTKQKEEEEEEGVKRVEGLFKNESKSGGLSLSSLFVSKMGRDREILKMENSDYKPLSPDMEKFVIHLYKNGYFKDSNFLPRNRFDITCFENSYAKDYVRFAAEQFGRDNREIAKWLSGSDLKKVASFGCPSIGKKIVLSAKGLRRFFGIQENTVCDKCVLKQSCKFVNQSGRKGDNKNLDLAVVMRVIPLYVLELVHPQLVVPKEIKNSASRLLKEAVHLSETLT